MRLWRSTKLSEGNGGVALVVYRAHESRAAAAAANERAARVLYTRDGLL